MYCSGNGLPEHSPKDQNTEESICKECNEKLKQCETCGGHGEEMIPFGEDGYTEISCSGCYGSGYVEIKK